MYMVPYCTKRLKNSTTIIITIVILILNEETLLDVVHIDENIHGVIICVLSKLGDLWCVCMVTRGARPIGSGYIASINGSMV